MPDAIRIGSRAREIFRRYVSAPHFPRGFPGRFYDLWIRPIGVAGDTLWYFSRFAMAVSRHAKRSLVGQMTDLARLWHGGVGPRPYYNLELYRPERRSWSASALTRYETKGGMLRRLHHLCPPSQGSRINLGDKVAYWAYCQKHDLPTPAIFIHAHKGKLEWLDGAGTGPDVALLDRDLFVKPRTSRGARGAMAFYWTGPLQYVDKDGRIWSARELLGYLTDNSKRQNLLLQPMLANNMILAGLADRSLIVFRVVTCMVETGCVLVTHGMLRVLSKLEPEWRGDDEYGAAVDLVSGVLGPMCSDKDLSPDAWSDNHPVTGAPVTGRKIPQWPAIRDLAIAGHEAFGDRFIIGWDIALTPAGPVLVEANSYPDVDFLQRVHRQAIGDSPLGPLLQRRFDQLVVKDAPYLRPSLTV